MISKLRMTNAFVGLAALMLLRGISADGWTATGDVTIVYSHGGTNFIVTTIPVNPCGSNGKFRWNATDSNGKDMYAMALAALTADKKIQVYYSGTD